MNYIYIERISDNYSIVDSPAENIGLNNGDDIVSDGKIYTVLSKVYIRDKGVVIIFVQQESDPTNRAERLTNII